MNTELRDILLAKNRMKGFVRRTPFDMSPLLSEKTGAQVYLKCENFQITGSFKLRGALNKMSLLAEGEKARGVITASAGNHAQGVACVANRFGIEATIVIPKTAPQIKIENTKRFGVNVVLAGTDYDECAQAARRLQKERGLVYVHAYNDPYIIAGQGTVGLEMMEEIPDLDIVLVPVGGGGLISGVARAVKSVNPKAKVFGIQAEVSRPWYESFKQKKYVDIPTQASIADGLSGGIDADMVDDFNQIVDDVFLVSEDEISHAIYWLVKNQRMIVEGSGAVGVAVLWNGKIDVKDKKVGMVLTGGNIDTKLLCDILNKYEQLVI